MAALTTPRPAASSRRSPSTSFMQACVAATIRLAAAVAAGSDDGGVASGARGPELGRDTLKDPSIKAELPRRAARRSLEKVGAGAAKREAASAGAAVWRARWAVQRAPARRMATWARRARMPDLTCRRDAMRAVWWDAAHDNRRGCRPGEQARDLDPGGVNAGLAVYPVGDPSGSKQ